MIMIKKNRIFLALAVLVVFLLAGALGKSYLAWKNHYQNRIYNGAKVGALDLSGQDYNGALGLISAQTKKIETEGLTFRYNQKSVNIAARVVSFDSDLSYPALAYDADATVRAAFGGTAERSFKYYLFSRLGLGGTKDIKAIYSLDENKIKELISDGFPDLSIPAVNAYFSVANGTLKVNPERLGRTIAFDEALSQLRNNLDGIKNETIALATRSDYPTVKQTDLNAFSSQAQNFYTVYSHQSLSLQFSESGPGATALKSWTIAPETIFSWLTVGSVESGLTVDQKKIGDYLSKTIAPAIDQEAQTPRFEIKDGKVSSWQSGQTGRQLDQAAVIRDLTKGILLGQAEVPLTVKTITSQAPAEGNLNIKEIIGTGHSNFSGSPPNRIHNIKTGAAAVNGLLIKPNEEFSLVTALGDVTAATGYLPELVIKGNKTVPEFGGGLCQIGTTVFRSALASGLPITARQSHSYRVSYYEPAGMDATIYIPRPDMRFINDTGNYILIQSRIEKNDLYFDFWGASDGRVATTTYPVIYNIVRPEPAKIIPTDSLKPGEKKCTESAHNGADAYFDYTVIYPAGATTTPEQTTRFKSHYVPWQKVCLIGTSTPISTSTPLSETTGTSSAPLGNQKATGTPAASSTNP